MVYDRQIYKQQQANTATEGARERRYFEGVKGIKGEEGELWGLANLFKLTAETVVTRDIINAQRQKELNYRIETFDVAQAGESFTYDAKQHICTSVMASMCENSLKTCENSFVDMQNPPDCLYAY